MPVITIQHISTFSSEDVNHPARNLLSSDTYRKWKCASAGEKQVVVVLQLETPMQIHSLDIGWPHALRLLSFYYHVVPTVIGNEGSAFVEVLVGRSSTADDYKVLLVASSFMSPADSKAWNNTNRVRMFGSEKLSKGVAEQKWDRVKVVCTQPYNKREQYGLSFITLHSPPGETPGHQEGEKVITPTIPHLGAFSLKEEPKTLPSGTLFYKKDPVLSPAGGSSAAAQARSATAAALRGDDSRSQVSPHKKGRRSEGESGGGKASKTTAVGNHSSGTPQKKKVPSSSKAKDSKSNIMSGVVFSLSGFKNPFRGELREKAVEMGASFQPDWNSTCTHLVCAFPSTPKFNQVKAKRGLIVRKEWVLDCYAKKKRLPASRYRVSGGSGDSSSEDEFYDGKERELFGTAGGKESAVRETQAASERTASSRGEGSGRGAVVGMKRSREEAEREVGEVKREVREVEKEVREDREAEEAGEDPYGGSTDEAEDMETDVVVKRKPLPQDSSSECDTEDEIQRIRAEQDIYAGTTETESDSDEKADDVAVRSLASLPDLFSNSHFMLYGSFSPADRRLVQRYITAYNGCIEDYMSEKISYIVTLEGWDANFDKALEDNRNLAFVQPQWIFKCHEKQSCVPHQPFAVMPS